MNGKPATNHLRRRLRLATRLGVAIAVAFAGASAAFAVHIPTSLDVDELWTPHPGPEGYLEFINPREHPNLIGIQVPATPPGVIMTEEYTGFTDIQGVDFIEEGDTDTTAGDYADFDWVQENRACETGLPCNNGLPVNHTDATGSPVVGAMGWTPGTPERSQHFDPGGIRGPGLGQHNHSVDEGLPNGLPVLENDPYPLEFFRGVDVFSVISIEQDEDTDENGLFSRRAAALDYEVAFGNSATGASSPGVPVRVWIPGWTPLTGIDDYVARWTPVIPGLYDLVAIEPESGFGHDGRTEIDAIKAFFIPEPATATLVLLAVAWVAGARRRLE